MSTASAAQLTDLLGDTRARIVELLHDEPRTAAELAPALGISAAAVRRHLTGLAADGLVESRPVHHGGRGRPSERYELTERARRLFPDRSAEFANEVLEHLERTFGRAAVLTFLRERASQHGERYAAALAHVEDAEERAKRLAELLSEDGFASEVAPVEGQTVLALTQGHCAIESIAREHPEICAHEAALFRRLLGAKVSRRTTIAEGADSCVCHVDLTS